MTKPFGPAEPSSVTTTYSTSFGQALAGSSCARGARAHHRHDLVPRRDRPDGHIDQRGDADSAADEEQVRRVPGQPYAVPQRPVHADNVAPRALAASHAVPLPTTL